MVPPGDSTPNELAFDTELFAFEAPADVKLQMLFLELDRVEKTIELTGTPYRFVGDEDRLFTIEAGAERYSRHSVWLRDSICGHVDPQCEGEDLYDCVLDQIRDTDLHDRTIWVLAHILALQGIGTLCAEEAN